MKDRRPGALVWFNLVLAACSPFLWAQSINNGTVTGTVKDPSGGVVDGATVILRNLVTGYEQTTVTDGFGAFRLNNVPKNDYRLTVEHAGFEKAAEEMDVHTSVPINIDISLKLSSQSSKYTVTATPSLIETDPSARQAVDRSSFLKLPSFNPGNQLSDAITHSSGGVAADANGFFHPLGDHGQVSYMLDGQPISDQQNKVFSTQIPANALQSMELITGSPDAQYGDKSSMIVNSTVRSGLGISKPFGEIEGTWGSFGTWSGSAALGVGNAQWGNFFVLNGIRSGRFSDTPQFSSFHGIGNNQSLVDRVDWQASQSDTLHLNLFLARNWFQVPNAYEQLGQDQKQRAMTWMIAPGYQHAFNAKTLLTVNPFVRRDQINYYPSRDPFADNPSTVAQNRFLTNYGLAAAVTSEHGKHTIEFGTRLQQTRLLENFQFGITNPAYNPVCLNAQGSYLLLPGVTNPDECSAINPTYMANPNLQPGLVPYDLTRGGTLFFFHGKANVNQFGFYFGDTIKQGNFTVNAGLREDQYHGLASANGLQPRLAISYLVPKLKTVLRVGYARTFETPYNENLILSSGTGSGGLAQNVFGSMSTPVLPGNRNQFNTGVQQEVGRWIIVDGDYFWKYTHNAYDFSVFFNTPITFPIAWHNSKLDGVTGRISSVRVHGFQGYMTFGHTRARFFPPENGGLIPLGGFPTSVFRIDHDQAYEQNVVLRYERPKSAEFIEFTWRYDSGLVVSGVPDVAAALTLTPAQQVTIGFSCNGVYATFSNPITVCNGIGKSTLLTLPQTGTANPDHNPNRVDGRNLFNLAIGTDNLLHSRDSNRITLRAEVLNLTNKVALYNFLSTFSGTHFVAPRSLQITLGYTF